MATDIETSNIYSAMMGYGVLPIVFSVLFMVIFPFVWCGVVGCNSQSKINR